MTTGYGESSTFSVVLNSAPAATVTIPVSSSNANEGTVYPSTLTFTKDDWDLPQLVQVTGVDDHKADGNVAYTVALGKTTSTDKNYSNITPASVAVTNQNFEVAGVQVWPTTGLIVTPGATTTFEVALTVAPTATVTIPISSSNGAAGKASTSALVFTATNWSTPQTVTITGQALATGASNTPFNIALAAATSSDPRYSKVGATTVGATDVVNRAAFESAQVAAGTAYINSLDMNGFPPGMNSMSMTTDCMNDDEAVFALVPFASATNTAIADGNWSDPHTWLNQQVPAPGANVWIQPNVTVTVDQQFTTPINWIRVTGTLRFNPHVNTALRVDTIVVDPNGTYMMGSQAEPVDNTHTAVVSFTDSGPINTTNDPQQFGRGLVSMGNSYIQGSAKSAYAALATVPAVGSTTLTLTAAPTNWKVGDALALGGEVSFAYGEQDFTITAISGTTVTLNAAVTLAFRGYSQSDEQLYVANLTRNVQFKSENTTTDPEQNGHVMFMHTANVSVRYAGFYHLGRTAGGPSPNDFAPTISGNDQRGRYAVHLHMDGDTAMDGTQVVQGCVVDGSPGWGYDNHGSHAIMTDNIAHNVANAGFVTEDGDESGLYARNMAIGGQGSGFWLHGVGVTLTDNIATGFTTQGFAGFNIFASTTVGLDGSYHFFPTADLNNPSLVDKYAPAGTVSIEHVPMYFARNIAYANYIGYAVWDANGSIDPVRADTIQGGVLWNNEMGIDFVYADDFTVRNVHMYSDIWSYNGITSDAAPAGMIYDNLTIVGFIDGLDAPAQGANRLSDGFFNNLNNIRVPFGNPPNAGVGIHIVDMRGPSFGTTLPPGHPTQWVETNILLDTSDISTFTGTNLWQLFAPNQILLNGQQLYFNNQLPNNVLSGTGVSFIDGKTNAQLYSQYLVAVGGEPAPATTAPVAGVTGGVGGAPVTVLPLAPVEYATTLTNWLTGLPGPADNLVPGWNLVPVTFMGTQRFIFVYGPSAPGATPSATKPPSNPTPDQSGPGGSSSGGSSVSRPAGPSSTVSPVPAAPLTPVAQALPTVNGSGSSHGKSHPHGPARHGGHHATTSHQSRHRRPGH
jgi:hypothetical protein